MVCKVEYNHRERHITWKRRVACTMPRNTYTLQFLISHKSAFQLQFLTNLLGSVSYPVHPAL